MGIIERLEEVDLGCILYKKYYTSTAVSAWSATPSRG